MKFRDFCNHGIGYLLFLCGLLTGLQAHPALANEPAPDTWYVETVTLDASELPADFHIYAGESIPEQLGEGVWLAANDPEESLRASIYLINNSEQPVYILSLEYRDRLVMATPDENYTARVRMAHEAASYLIREGSGEVFTLDREGMMDLDESLTDPNPPATLPPPPGTTVPAAQYSELLLVYGEQVVLLPFSITYTLNPEFESEDDWPTSTPESTAALTSGNGLEGGQKIILVLAGVGLAVLTAWLVWRWRKGARIQ